MSGNKDLAVPHLGPAAVTIPAAYGTQHVGRGTSPVNIPAVLEPLHGELWTCFGGAQSGVAELMLLFRPGAAPQAAVITATLFFELPSN